MRLLGKVWRTESIHHCGPVWRLSSTSQIPQCYCKTMAIGTWPIDRDGNDLNTDTRIIEQKPLNA